MLANSVNKGSEKTTRRNLEKAKIELEEKKQERDELKMELDTISENAKNTTGTIGEKFVDQLQCLLKVFKKRREYSREATQKMIDTMCQNQSDAIDIVDTTCEQGTQCTIFMDH